MECPKYYVSLMRTRQNSKDQDNDNKRAFPYAAEVLEHLVTKYKLALITNVQTNISTERVIEILRDTGIPNVFDVILVSSEVGISKPNPCIFELALKKLEVTPKEAVMIGNTISTDIFGGNRVGMKTVLFQTDKEYRRSEWENPDHTIHSLKELLDII